MSDKLNETKVNEKEMETKEFEKQVVDIDELSTKEVGKIYRKRLAKDIKEKAPGIAKKVILIGGAIVIGVGVYEMSKSDSDDNSIGNNGNVDIPDVQVTDIPNDVVVDDVKTEI